MKIQKEMHQRIYSRPSLDPTTEDSLAKIAHHVPGGSTVLDVGCATGALGRHLIEHKGCHVDGIEGNAEAAELARPFYHRLVVTDLESVDFGDVLGAELYDRIICADVLEHLRYPGETLEGLRNHLAPGGKILISIPNFGHIGLLLELLSGDLRYRDQGLLDKTHLRFFTRKSFLRLLTDHGFTGRVIDSTVSDIQHTEFAYLKAQQMDAGFFRQMQSMPDNLTYQFIVEAIPAIAPTLIVETPNPAIAPLSPLTPRFYVSVYWRTGDENFDESRSLSCSRPFGVERSLVQFDLPALSEQHSLRLDPSDQPGFLRLYDISLFRGDERVWRWDGIPHTLMSGPYNDIEASPIHFGDPGISLLLKDEDPWFVLPIPSTQLSGADRLEVELSWPMSPDYVFALKHIETRLKKDQVPENARAAPPVRAEAPLSQFPSHPQDGEQSLAGMSAGGPQDEVAPSQSSIADISASKKDPVDILKAQVTLLEQENRALAAHLALIIRSRAWRMTKPVRALNEVFVSARGLSARNEQGKMRRYSLMRRLYHTLPLSTEVKRKLHSLLKPLSPSRSYQEWIRQYDAPSKKDEMAIKQQIASWANTRRISVIMPVYNPQDKFLRMAIESVRRQSYPDWELCIVDDASSQPHVREILRAYARTDVRIKVHFRSENGHICAASNDALSLATGDYIALLDHDDVLAEHALYWVQSEIRAHPEAELIYSDEDKIGEDGQRCDPYFKPDWNPELLLGQNYINHLGIYKRQRVLDIGGFRVGFEGSQDWDLVLRFTEDLDAALIRHIPAVLYHWRITSQSTAKDPAIKPYAAKAAESAVAEALERRGELFHLDRACNGAFQLPRFRVQGSPLVSIIIPTRNGFSDLHNCLDSLSRTAYENFEILIIDNESDDPATLAYLSTLQRDSNIRVISYPHPFNYAEMHNWAVPQASGEYVCLLNNDTEVIEERWLTDMLAQAQRSGVGAVGAKLLYPDGAIQHGGVLLGIGGVAGHAHKMRNKESPGYFGRAALVQNFSAVTAACLLMKKDYWDRAGGMAPQLAVAFNDVDLCLRLQEAGLRNVWLPQALLFHHESKSRGSDEQPDKQHRFALEHAFMQWRWGVKLSKDPAYNPNLTIEREDFSLGWPPRAPRPWRSNHFSIDIPYGLPGMHGTPLTLRRGEGISGCFKIPMGTRGILIGVSLLIEGYLGSPSFSLTLQLDDRVSQKAEAHATVHGPLYHSMVPINFSREEILLDGQERLFFHLRLDGPAESLTVWSCILNKQWGHQIEGCEDRVLRFALQVTTHLT